MNKRYKIPIMFFLAILFGILILFLLFFKSSGYLTKFITKSKKAVVMIIALDAEGRPLSQGSGFIISRDGKVVTNYHVLEDAEAVIVKTSKGEAFTKCSIFEVDRLKDIAIIQLEGANNLPSVKLGDSDKIKTGEKVFSISNPMGLELTASEGIVSSIRESSLGFRLIQITVPISEGSSGGPLFNAKNEVIGITSLILTEGQNLNFAVPVNNVKRLIIGKTEKKIAKLKEIPEKLPSRSDQRQIESEKILQEKPIDFAKDLGPYITYIIQQGDNFVEIAKKYNTTVDLILKINSIDDSSKVPVGLAIKISNTKLSINVDISSNQLILLVNNQALKTYKISTGGDKTPIGNYKIINKLTNPTWFKSGKVFPPGDPENILGSRWLGLNLGGYGIHGTTDSQSLGKQITQGSIRMSNSDIEELYIIIPVGTEVIIK